MGSPSFKSGKAPWIWKVPVSGSSFRSGNASSWSGGSVFRSKKTYSCHSVMEDEKIVQWESGSREGKVMKEETEAGGNGSN
jgi:hypothetical protein